MGQFKVDFSFHRFQVENLGERDELVNNASLANPFLPTFSLKNNNKRKSHFFNFFKGQILFNTLNF